jgi:hypothetical protein
MATTLARRQDPRYRRVPWSPTAWRQALYLTGSIPVLLAAPVLVAAGFLHPPKWALPLLFLLVIEVATGRDAGRSITVSTAGGPLTVGP